MKNLFLLILCLVGLTLTHQDALYSQSPSRIDVLREVGATNEEIRKITALEAENERKKRIYSAELTFNREESQRLLADPNVDMALVEKNLKASSDWRFKTELSEIKTRIEIRKILGEERWNRLGQLVEIYKKKNSQLLPSASSDGPEISFAPPVNLGKL